MTDTSPILEARGIDHDYGTVSVLQDVSVTIPKGSVTALIGPNGAGKTTLIRDLAGLHEPTAGEITYHGPETAREIGYLPQHPAFRPGFTCRETLEFYASLVGDDEAAAMEHLSRVGLEDAAERNVEALSGGMTRLLGIAQATIGDPPIIVLDEPGSGLDPGMSMHVFDVASELADEGITILLSSHDLELVERIADEVLVLSDGQIVQRGSMTELRNRFGVDSLWSVYENAIGGDLDTVRVQGEHA
ncbi:ABC transporter ATP-binding protein [Natronolimnohabitans sp. A-GB9]|uniref:ABC transporter ATP-binding protein n=1 Tax=Natronolimnohabitans sp. A-GB9 TaxID=3069757 RepID=UPI0027AFB6A7|nr:ABC transporter ATP-binding protein [Natronolimnohabitans sp. A-GB9]MDQ2049991.1 ABC transporter ATP-binding protein [Natronolimnohabitans sp. A-GB9]